MLQSSDMNGIRGHNLVTVYIFPHFNEDDEEEEDEDVEEDLENAEHIP